MDPESGKHVTVERPKELVQQFSDTVAKLKLGIKSEDEGVAIESTRGILPQIHSFSNLQHPGQAQEFQIRRC